MKKKNILTFIVIAFALLAALVLLVMKDLHDDKTGAQTSLDALQQVHIPDDANDGTTSQFTNTKPAPVKVAKTPVATTTMQRAPRPVVMGDTLTQQNILDAVNAARWDAGYPALKENAQLDAAAQAKLADMVKNEYFAHDSPEGLTPWYWITASGYLYQYAGENLADDFDTTSATVAAWIASPTHYANIRKPQYTETGIAVDTVDVFTSAGVVQKNIVVQEFASPVK